MSSLSPITPVTSNGSTGSTSTQSTVYPDAPPAYTEFPQDTSPAQTAKLSNHKRTLKSFFGKARVEQEAVVEIQTFSPEVLAAISIFPTCKMTKNAKAPTREPQHTEVITNPYSRFRPDDLKEPKWLERKFF